MVSVHSKRKPEGEGGGQVVRTEADPGHQSIRLPAEHGPVLWSGLQGNDIYIYIYARLNSLNA